MKTIYYYVAVLMFAGVALSAASAYIERASGIFPPSFWRLFLNNAKWFVTASAVFAAGLVGVCMLEAACL